LTKERHLRERNQQVAMRPAGVMHSPLGRAPDAPAAKASTLPKTNSADKGGGASRKRVVRSSSATDGAALKKGLAIGQPRR
jgi:hypothetical protein